jgi:hemoglobin-like flavoprotein
MLRQRSIKLLMYFSCSLKSLALKIIKQDTGAHLDQQIKKYPEIFRVFDQTTERTKAQYHALAARSPHSIDYDHLSQL